MTTQIILIGLVNWNKKSNILTIKPENSDDLSVIHSAGVKSDRKPLCRPLVTATEGLRHVRLYQNWTLSHPGLSSSSLEFLHRVIKANLSSWSQIHAGSNLMPCVYLYHFSGRAAVLTAKLRVLLVSWFNWVKAAGKQILVLKPQGLFSAWNEWITWYEGGGGGSSPPSPVWHVPHTPKPKLSSTLVLTRLLSP